MSMFGNMFNSMSEAARNQGGSIRMPLPFGRGIRIPLDALGRMAGKKTTRYVPRPPQGGPVRDPGMEIGPVGQAPPWLKSLPAFNMDLSNLGDAQTKSRIIENLPYVRPATRPFLPGMGSVPAATRPFLPGTGGTVRPFDMNSEQDRQVIEWINELNSRLGR